MVLGGKTQNRRKRLRRACLLACGLLLLTASGARADLSYLELSLEELLETNAYTATRRAEPLFETAAAVHIITNEDIRRAGVTTIPDALRMAPGVQVAQIDAHSWAISIRGFNANLANKLLVMIDGRTIYNPLHAGTYWQAHNLMLEDVERIEVVRGPGGALWGANAVNGVINIITKSAKETQGNLISHGYGNHERGFVNARRGGLINDNLFYRIYGKYFKRGSLRPASGEGSGVDKWDGYRSGFRLDWDKDRVNDFTLQGDVYRTDLGRYFQNYSLTAPYSTVETETAENNGAYLLGRWDRNFNDGSKMTLQSFLDYTVRAENLLKDERFIFDIDGQYNFAPIGRHNVIAGAGFGYMADRLTGSDLVDFNPARRRDPLYSAFIQDKITLAPDALYLTLGSKFEHNFYTGFEVQPSARLQWFPDERQTVWAAISRAVRTPSRIERDLTITEVILPPNSGLGPLPAALDLVHNRNFELETLIAYEAGYRNQLTPDLMVDGTIFVNHYRNLRTLNSLGIVADGPPPHLRVPLMINNEMTAETYGAEISVGWDVNERLNIAATYSYLEMFLHAPRILGFTQEGAEGQSPVHQASVRANWDINDRLSLNTSLYYADQLRTSDVPSYVRLDMNLDWQLADGLRFNLIGQNLLDGNRTEFAPTGVNTTKTGTSVFGKLTWEF